MAEIKINSDDALTKAVFSEAIKTEQNRIGYALQLGQKFFCVNGRRKNWRGKTLNTLNGQAR